ncbi:MAG: metallophosphoesterase [Rhizomicrobium sp.]
MRRLAFPIIALALTACTGGNPPPPTSSSANPKPVSAQAAVSGPGKVLAYWEQLGPYGTRDVRAVMSGNECPRLATQHAYLPMQARAQANGEFALVCSALIPSGGVDVELATTNEPAEHFPLPKMIADPQRILVIGDTGCRLKGSAIQPCNDAQQWPFSALARKAADLKPDLVIHVGDYLYRENACPANDAGCQGTPFGDNWPTWAADFFTPAQPLLAAAPWVFVRGNHEDCQRAGPGWTRLLAPARFDPANICADHTVPYFVPLATMKLIVMDDANAPDTAVDASVVPAYRSELAALGNETQPVWLLMHRPIWAAISGPLGVPMGGNATMIEAAGTGGIPKPVALLLAGHIHTFEAINYKDKVPPQIVAGGGGDLLDKTPEDLKGAIFQGSSGVSVKDGLSVNGFSFLLMSKQANGWDIALYDSSGTVEHHCVFADGRVDCRATK